MNSLYLSLSVYVYVPFVVINPTLLFKASEKGLNDKEEQKKEMTKQAEKPCCHCCNFHFN